MKILFNIKNMIFRQVFLLIFLQAFFFMASAQNVDTEIRGINIVSCTTFTFEIWMKAGTGYVSQTAPFNSTTNPETNGAFTGMTLRFDFTFSDPAIVTTGFTTTTARVAGLTTSGGSVSQAPRAPADIAIGVTFGRPSDNSLPDLTGSYVKYTTITVNLPAQAVGVCVLPNDKNEIRLDNSTTGSRWSNAVPSSGRPFTGTATILPVNFSSFTGTNVNCSALLKWSTESESISSHYIVEASTDGSNYSQVGQVTSKNAALGSSYSYSTPLVGANNFFRIKAVDFDGKTAYNTKIVTIKNTCLGTATIGIYPNPTANTVTIYGLHGRNTINITNELGQKMATILNTTNAQVVPAAKYPSGNYVIGIVNQDGTSQSIKFVKM